MIINLFSIYYLKFVKKMGTFNKISKITVET